MPNYFLLSGILFMTCVFLVAIYQREEWKEMYQENKRLLIDFGHARYIIDPVTGESKFQIDSPPVKNKEID